MKLTHPIPLFACVGLVVAGTAVCPAEDIFSAAITAKVKLQGSRTQNVNCERVNGQKVCDEVEVNTVESFALNNRTLANLILGRSPFSPPPPNVAFGISFGCEGDDTAQLVILDRLTSNMLAVADISETDLIYNAKVFCGDSGPCEVVNTSFEGFLVITFRALGSPGTNSIDGGSIRLYAKGSLNSDGCIVKVIGSGSGKIEATSDGEAVEVFVANLTLTTGRKIGTLATTTQASSESAGVIASGSGLQGYVDTSVSAVTRVWSRTDRINASKWLSELPQAPQPAD